MRITTISEYLEDRYGVALRLLPAGLWMLYYALFAGGFFGLAMYATYDLTNLATLRDWPVFITVVDLVWGTFVCSATSAVVTAILMRR